MPYMQWMRRPRLRGRKKGRKYPLKKILVYGTIAALFLGVGFYFTLDYLIQGSPSNCSQVTVPRAAIVDQLSITQPNEPFVEEAKALLNEAGFLVDYYDSDNVTVNFYRNLPTHCYRLILLRVHSGSATEGEIMDLFTSELYDESKYVGEQMKTRLGAVALLPYQPGDPLYFSITHGFVRSSMKGKFNNAVIIMMGCEGLKWNNMAEAFIEKGAQVYVGWNELVSASHTDQATIDLLRRFLIEKQTIEEAINGTMDEIGADPQYDSVLSYYPPERGNSTSVVESAILSRLS